jgi:dTDP-4-amino-4,6-dideoxygalactose transaminase
MAYKVPFVDLPAHFKHLENELKLLLEDVLFTRADFIMRSDLREFENNIASYVGVNYAVGVNSGFDALHFSALSAGLSPGDEVITVGHTFVATVAAIVHCGATPILVDIGDDFNMDMQQLEQAISTRTKAVIPVHLNGRLCDMEKLMNLANMHNLLVIEDAAQALGANFDGKKAGSFGLTGCFSLYPMKILGGAGDGGIVVTNDEKIEQKIRFLRDHGQNRETRELTGYGFNSRLDNLQASILNMKLKYLPQWIERRREIANIYHQGLSGISDIKLPPPPQTNGQYFDVFQNYVVCAHDRDRLVSYLKEDCDIEVLISWSIPMHHHEALGLSHFKLPNTEKISREVVSLPMNTEISNEQVEYVIDCVRNFYKKL